MSKTQKTNHGLFGGLIKIIMVIAFAIIGIISIIIGTVAICAIKEGQLWVKILYIVFGCCLLTAPFFLNKKRGGLITVIRVLMIIVFVLIGILYITGGIWSLVEGTMAKNGYIWIPIVELVFGCLLLTSPYFLRKDI